MRKVKETRDIKLPHPVAIKLQAVYDSLKSAERKAADYMLQYPARLASGTIGEAAAQAGCSEATFVRLARKLGYKGYCQLKQACGDGSLEPNLKGTYVYDTVSRQDSPGMVARKVFQAAVQALNDSMQSIGGADYERGLTAVKQAGRILLLGSGDAYIAAYSAYLKFSRIGLYAVCPSDYDVQLLEASRLTAKDVILCISHSGNTKTLHEAVQTGREKGAFILTITNYPLSPLAKLSDAVILTAAFIKNPQNETMAKRIPQLCVIEAMYVTLLQSKEVPYEQCLEAADKELQKNKLP